MAYAQYPPRENVNLTESSYYSKATPLSQPTFNHRQDVDEHLVPQYLAADLELPPTHKNRLSMLKGWRLSVLLGLITTVIVLIANIAVLAWAYSCLEIKDGSAIAWAGTQNNLKGVSTWTHLAVNILGSLLLAASNNAMQCLVAPTREEIEKAHSKGKWMQIGVPGMHNFGKIRRRRALLWLLLLLSSIPIHLL